MLFRFSEVASVLALVLTLIVLKHVPVASELPLSHMAGIACFAFAIFLSLRIYRDELRRIAAGE